MTISFTILAVVCSALLAFCITLTCQISPISEMLRVYKKAYFKHVEEIHELRRKNNDLKRENEYLKNTLGMN